MKRLRFKADEVRDRRLISDSQRISDLEMITSLHQGQMDMLAETIKDMSITVSAGFAKAFDSLKKIQKNTNLMNMKIQALASILVDETDIEIDEVEKRLDQIRMMSMNVEAEIDKLIEDSKKFEED